MNHKILQVLPAVLVALVFSFTYSAGAQYAETTLYNFGASSTDAQSPSWGLIRDAGGNLYGASNLSGGGQGAVYELSPSTGGGWTETVLHQFIGGVSGDAETPSGPLTMDASGNLYGVTQSGGAHSKGAVYEISPNSSGGWTETLIYSFAGGTDGQWATGSLTFDTAGNLYGTTYEGGSGTNANCVNAGCGTVFELSPSSSGWTEKVIYNFTGGADGMGGGGNLLFDSAGRLYGAAVYGGVQGSGCFDGCGTIYRLTPVSGGWRFARLFDFQGQVGGASPGAIVFDAEGNIYGIGFTGGSYCLPLGCGVVFELMPQASGGPWKEKVLHIFSELHDGGGPGGGIAFDSTGNLYGTADFGGSGNLGTVWKLTPGANGFWPLTQLYSFGNGSTGSRPNSGVILDSLGNLYGTTQQDGLFGRGTVFELSP